MGKKKQSRVGNQIVARLRDFTRKKLKRGEEFDVTTVRREMTPDGPLHTVTKSRKRLN